MPLEQKRNEMGFTIVEVSIGMAILLVAGITLASFSKSAFTNRATTEKRLAALALSSTIVEHLRINEACELALGAGSGLSQIVDETRLEQSGLSESNGWQFEMVLPEIRSGLSMSGASVSAAPPNNILADRRLQINSLKLADGRRLPDIAGNRRYIATIYLKASEIGGTVFKERAIGSTQLMINAATSSIISCGVVSSGSFGSICQDLGCKFEPSRNPPCICLRSQVVCSAPGAVPVAFTEDGYPTCIQAGGEQSCPTDEYLVGFGIGYKECAKLPTASTSVNGGCGIANGQTFANATAANTAGLCSTGQPSPASLSGSGPWSWSCVGANGGSSASCTAVQAVASPTPLQWIASSASSTGGIPAAFSCASPSPTLSFVPSVGYNSGVGCVTSGSTCKIPFNSGGMNWLIIFKCQ